MSMLDALGRPRTLGVLLAISVAINLLLLGLVAGRVSAAWMHPAPVAWRFERGMPFIPAHHREDMFRAVREGMPDMREQHRKMRRLHREVAEELSKPQPERALLEKKLADIRAQMQLTQQALQGAFLDTVMKMPLEERREMMERMRHMRRHARGAMGMPPPDAVFNAPLPPPPQRPAVNEP